MKSLDYVVANPDSYAPDHTLHVLIGARPAAGGDFNQRAIFFAGDTYLGTDTLAPSAKVNVVVEGDSSVTLN